jgi:cytochrome oxidase assembly protein ShyY1
MKRLQEQKRKLCNSNEYKPDIDNMARKKKIKENSELEVVVSKVEEIKEDINIPTTDELQRVTILDLREKGFDDNRIAARLMIQKSIVENIK